MAEFYQVHRVKADRPMSPGEFWQVIVEEPFDFASLGKGIAPCDSVTSILFECRREGERLVLCPTAGAQKVIDDWNKRHADTDPERFTFPDGVLNGRES